MRRLLISALAALALLLGAAPAQAAGVRGLPSVDMALVVAAAQVEGLRGNQPGLGDDSSTRLVQQALRARGYAVVVDGHFGRATTKAYAAFQRSLGYTSIDANGLPGPESLARLGRGRFGVVDQVEVGSRKDHFGKIRVNSRTKLMLTTADAKLAWDLVLDQGSYCSFQTVGCAGASSGTHDGGGVVDVSVRGLSTAQRWQVVQAMRSVGFAAWLRTPSQCGGCWNAHVHAIAIGDTDLWQRNGAYTNRDQVADYFVGRSGLSGHPFDDTPARYRVAFTTWERYLVTG